MLGILCHKGSAAFALMISIHRGHVVMQRRMPMLAVFVLMAPVGVLLGTAAGLKLDESGMDTNLIEGSFNAIAAGTFIYVAIMNIIDEELSKHNVRVAKFVMSALAGHDDQPMPMRDSDRRTKFVLVILGIAFMALLIYFAHH